MLSCPGRSVVDVSWVTGTVTVDGTSTRKLLNVSRNDVFDSIGARSISHWPSFWFTASVNNHACAVRFTSANWLGNAGLAV